MTTARSICTTLALLLALCLLAACGGDTPSTDAAPAPANAATTNQAADQPASASPITAAVTLPDDPKAAILQALRAQLTAGPYRSTTTIDMDGGAQTMVGEVAPPDRMHVVMGLGGIKTEMIYIGDKTWSKQGDTAWVESDSMGAPGTALLDESMIADTERTITEAALVGPEQIEGVAALLYTFTTDLSKSEVMPMEGVMHAKLWVATDSGLIIRQETESAMADTSSTTVQVVEYDPTITIEPPVQ